MLQDRIQEEKNIMVNLHITKNKEGGIISPC